MSNLPDLTRISFIIFRVTVQRIMCTIHMDTISCLRSKPRREILIRTYTQKRDNFYDLDLLCAYRKISLSRKCHLLKCKTINFIAACYQKIENASDILAEIIVLKLVLIFYNLQFSIFYTKNIIIKLFENGKKLTAN